MPTNALVLDVGAVNVLSGAALSDDWFRECPLPPDRTDLGRTVISNTTYILSRDANEGSQLFICNLRPDGIGTKNRHILFSRALRIVLATFGKTVGIPRSYRLHREGALFSIFAYHYAVSQARAHFRQDGHRMFLYALTDHAEDLSRVNLPEDLYSQTIESYEDALLAVWDSDHEQTFGSFGIVFHDFVGRTYGQPDVSIEEWCTNELTTQQLKFVNASLDRPIRLRGSPGTGKTQCMAIKCLKELFDADNSNSPLRAAFITHSSGVAHEVVEGMMWALDPDNRRNEIQSSLWLGSLYELAKETLGYEKKEIVPLSLDGVEGRRFQQDLVGDCVFDCLREPDFLDRLSGCSDYVRDGLTEPIEERFLRELANEVACSLDSEGVRLSNRERVQEYLEGQRSLWQMNLENRADRRAVLDIHTKYVELLADSDTINLDQMVADLYGYLNSHEWSVSKRSQGFDVVFIDELHYFNRYERLVFHLLVKEDAINEGRVPLFMAYDLKQSTDDRALTSVGGAGRFFRGLHAGNSELVELTQVFRSTPEIAQLLELIDGAFPALDLEGEWQAYAGQSERESGNTPELRLFSTQIDMLDAIVSEAQRYARQEGGNNVAVLCMSESAFTTFANAGRVASKISVVESNSDLSPIRNARQRCVFSMPENVAGLQFDRVYVINVDQQELDDEEMSFGARRQMLSRLYLGVSRASKHLVLAASTDCGGESIVLQRPQELGVLDLK